LKGLEKRRAWAAYWFIGPWFLGFLTFTVYPLLYSLYASLCAWSYEKLEWNWFSNYVKVFSDVDFWRCGITTFIYGLVSTPITLSFALLLALLINQKLKGVKFFRALYFLPVVAASDVISTTAGRILFSRITVVNIDVSRLGLNIPGAFHFVRQDWVNYFIATLIPILLTLALWRTGIQMLIFLMGLNNVPYEYYEAAEMDGATGWQKFWWVTMPSIAPLILLNVLLTIVESFTGLATSVQMVTGGLVNLFIWDYVNFWYGERADFSVASAVIWVFIVVTVALIGLVYKMMDRKVTY
jgi:ABC-type sugar transport system permease subunit